MRLKGNEHSAVGQKMKQWVEVSILKHGFGDGTRQREVQSFNKAFIKVDSLHSTRAPGGRKNENEMQKKGMFKDRK